MRQFGCILGLILAGCGAYLLWQGRASGSVLLAVAVLAAAAIWRQWPGTKAFFSGWMKVARGMGRISTGLLLSVIYYCVLTPLALLARLCGERFLDREFRSGELSYWRVPCRRDSSNTGDRQY